MKTAIVTVVMLGIAGGLQACSKFERWGWADNNCTGKAQGYGGGYCERYKAGS